MASLEEVFHGSQLALHIPDQPVSLANAFELNGDELLDQLQRSSQRDQVFFDERLSSFLTLSIPNLPVNATSPPAALLQFLSHLAITLDASYVAKTVAPERREKPTTLLTLPPHLTGNARPKLQAKSDGRPSIFPPATPNPVPFTEESDRGYSQADNGVALYSYAWGDGQAEDAATFALLRCQRHAAWVAVYRLDVSVAFVRNIMQNPLLCLTVSSTIRDRPIAHTPQRQALFDLVTAHGGQLEENQPSPAVANFANADDDDLLDDFEEVNLLEGLALVGVDLHLPSARIGLSMRKESYSLTTQLSDGPSTLSSPAAARALPTLRKSYRKTLSAVSGFAVKMRSVLSPAVVIPGDTEDEQEQRETGSEERTIVLCVELENTGESKLGFQVDTVQVRVSGDGARAKLIAWGEQAFESPESVFPLRVGAREQYNLLYAVSFLRPADEQDVPSYAPTPNRPPNDLLRSVSIAITGRPFETRADAVDVAYPTPPFVTRWSCTLNLSPSHHTQTPLNDRPATPLTAQDALPAPPSPFPTSSPRIQRPASEEPINGPRVQSPATFAGKRHTLGAAIGTPEIKLANRPFSMPFGPGGTPGTPRTGTPGTPRAGTPPTNKFLPPPPNIAFQPSSTPGSPLPSPSLPPSPRGGPPVEMFPPQAQYAMGIPQLGGVTPPTPAYPAFSADTPHPATPRALSPMAAAGSGYAGPSIEARRERVPANVGLGLPLSPLPISPGTRTFFPPPGTPLERHVMEPIVVSIGLVSEGGYDGKIYALRQPFYLDIFVFNQSSRTRRLEISHPEPARKRRNTTTVDRKAVLDLVMQLDEDFKGPGLLPLENRIRIGPLRPNACQSVRFPFIALQPGVHAISALSLMDVETGYAVNMRHAFYETDERVTVSIFEKNVDPDKVQIKFESHKFSYEHGDTKLVLEPLRSAIDPAGSDYTVGKVKVEVRFAKTIAGRWGTLVNESEEPAPIAAPTSQPVTEAPRKQHKNWDAVTNEVLNKEKDKTIQEDPNAGGDTALNGFFQQIYANADEDTKRAMMKSFTESGGTALSTNWDEDIFRRLKTICVPLLASTELTPANAPKVTTLLRTLADELDAVPDAVKPLKGSLISYAFFPVSTLLRRNALDVIPDRVLEGVLRVLGLLAQHWWWSADARTWEQLLMLVALVVAGVDRKDKGRTLEEPTQLAAVRALYLILGGHARTDPVSSERLGTYQPHAQVSVVGKTLDALLGLCTSANLDLQLDALRTTHVLVRDFLPEDLAPSVMPGVVSIMVRAALGQNTRKGWSNGDAVAAALDALSAIVHKAISDDVCISAGIVVRLHDLSDITNIVSEAVEEEAHAQGGLTKRTTSWLRGSATQLHIALNSLTQLLSHENAAALRSLATLSRDVLRSTTLTLPQSRPLLVSFLLALSRSDYNSVFSTAHSALVTVAQEPAVLEHVLDIAREAMADLPRLIRTQADAKLALRLKQILAVCSLSREIPSVATGVARFLSAGGGIEKWGLGLLAALQFLPSTQAGVVAEASLLLDAPEGEDDWEFPPMRLASPADSSVLALLEQTLCELGRVGGIYAAEWLVGLGAHERSPRSIAALWCAAHIAEGAAHGAHSRSTGKLFKAARWMAKAVAELWQVREEDEVPSDAARASDAEDDKTNLEFVKGLVKVDTSAVFPTPRSEARAAVWSPEMHRAAALRIIVAASSALRAAFSPLLLQTLYPLLHALVSQSPLLRSTAMAALHNIARSTGFATPRNLLMSNFDYALAGAGARLLRAQLDVDAAKVLRILVQLVGSDVVDKMGDVVAECFERLDEYHGYDVLVEGMVDVLREVVRILCEDVESRESGAGSEPHPPPAKKMDIFQEQTVEQLLQWLEQRRQSPPQEDDDEDYGTVPREAWGKKAEVEAEEEDPDTHPAYKEPEKPQPTATHKLVHLILSRSVPFLTHSSPLIRARILSLLTSAVPVLGHDNSEDNPGIPLLLPQIHRAWPFVLNRLVDSEPFVVAAAIGLIAALSASPGAGEFVKARIWDDVWPRFKSMLDALQVAESQSALAQRRSGGSSAASAYANSTRLHVAMLHTMDAALRGPGGAQDTAVWDVAIAFCRFLDRGQDAGVQKAALRVFRALRAANEDAIWLALSSSVGSDLLADDDDQTQVTFPTCLLRNWDIKDNATNELEWIRSSSDARKLLSTLN
ncbi:hypothetical protein AURDEDRAFT_118550 [Auricularia subglabra TFB-10046 SS5]|nr:hypothetical protein AURDEDRAFT_118550 [Auricularia subglabra TFB-10046 SS5]